jgi:hypothetical protein
MRNAVARFEENPSSEAAQLAGNEASQAYKRRRTTFADGAAISNQSLATGIGSFIAFGGRSVANSFTDTAAKASIPNTYAATAASAVVKYGLGTFAAAGGTQLNQNKTAPFLDQNTGPRHAKTPLAFILPDTYRNALNNLKPGYGDGVLAAIKAKQNAAATPNATIGALAYATGAIGSALGQYAVSNPGAKAAIGAAGPTAGGLALGAATGVQKATATFKAPSREAIDGLTRRHINKQLTSDEMDLELENMKLQPHNLFYTADPSAAEKAEDLAKKADERPRTLKGQSESLVHRTVGMEKGLRGANIVQTAGAIGGVALDTISPFGGAALRAVANGVGIGGAVQVGLLAQVGKLNENDKAIADREPQRVYTDLDDTNQTSLAATQAALAATQIPPLPEDLAEQGRARL